VDSAELYFSTALRRCDRNISELQQCGQGRLESGFISNTPYEARIFLPNPCSHMDRSVCGGWLELMAARKIESAEAVSPANLHCPFLFSVAAKTIETRALFHRDSSIQTQFVLLPVRSGLRLPRIHRAQHARKRFADFGELSKVRLLWLRRVPRMLQRLFAFAQGRIDGRIQARPEKCFSLVHSETLTDSHRALIFDSKH
jgi:hypothetical protein